MNLGPKSWGNTHARQRVEKGEGSANQCPLRSVAYRSAARQSSQEDQLRGEAPCRRKSGKRSRRFRHRLPCDEGGRDRSFSRSIGFASAGRIQSATRLQSQSLGSLLGDSDTQKPRLVLGFFIFLKEEHSEHCLC